MLLWDYCEEVVIVRIAITIITVFFFVVPLCNFLLGEGKLETFLEEWPPLESNVNKARSGLGESKRCLLNAASEQGKKVNINYAVYELNILSNSWMINMRVAVYYSTPP